MVAALNFFLWALSDAELNVEDLAEVIVWSVVWLVHWLIARRSIDSRRMQAHLLAGSAVGLVAIAAALWEAGSTALKHSYDLGFDTSLLSGERSLEELVLEPAALFIVGLVVWVRYWAASAARSPQTPLWNLYVMIGGVLGGMVTALTAAGLLIAVGLEWVIGETGDTGAIEHFDGTPQLATVLVIGSFVWAYHGSILRARTVERTESRRAYEYLISALGLVALTVGVAALIVSLLEAATDMASSGREPLVAGISLVVIGTPLWLVTWIGLKKRCDLFPERELSSLARKVYLYGFLGVAAMAAVASLVVVIVIVLEDIFGGGFGTATISDSAEAIGLLVGALAVTGYHWAVYQDDRIRLPDPDRPQLRDVVLVCTNGEVIAAATPQGALRGASRVGQPATRLGSANARCPQEGCHRRTAGPVPGASPGKRTASYHRRVPVAV